MYQLLRYVEELSTHVQPLLNANQVWSFKMETLIRSRHQHQYRVWQPGEINIRIYPDRHEIHVRRKAYRTIDPMSVSPDYTVQWESLEYPDYQYSALPRLQRMQWHPDTLRKAIRTQ